ncbi:TetR/AcrR family transcriptional regulator [Burkholderia cepacia]|uniref:TetR/AcrR family transcriptional regulator n=1 Tax=Burkholderia cepacia TaxID=292 RepID=UPI001E472A44|nr:TetR family transcriptional regulator [Burkholderia cepacia]
MLRQIHVDPAVIRVGKAIDDLAFDRMLQVAINEATTACGIDQAGMSLLLYSRIITFESETAGEMAPSSTTPKRATKKRTRGRPMSSALMGFDSLLRGARQMFATHGYEGTSVRAIAQLAGVDPALMAHHFGSKQGLWIAVVEQLSQQLEPMIEATKQLGAARMSQRERVKQAIILFIETVSEDRYLGMFFATATTEQGERLNILLERYIRPYREAFVPLLIDAIETGKLKPHDPDAMYFMMLMSISNAMSYSHILSTFTPLPKSPEKFKEEVLDIALGMFR